MGRGWGIMEVEKVRSLNSLYLPYLVGNIIIRTDFVIFLLPRHKKGNIVNIILQQPFEGLTIVLAKLNDKPAQNKTIILRVPALSENTGLGFSLHLLWLLSRRFVLKTAGHVFQSILRAASLHFPGRGLPESWVTILMKRFPKMRPTNIFIQFYEQPHV